MINMNKIMVISNDGSKDIFKPRLIGQFIKEKTDANDDIINKIQNRVTLKFRNLGVSEITTTQIMAEVTAQLTKEGIKEEPYVVIKESDIMNLLTSYDNNNANQVFSAGALEYSLFEMTAKRYMNTQYSDEFREAKDYGLIYNHDSAQELFKGINCFTIDPRFIFKKGLSTYGDNNLGVISSPPKHLGTAINLVEEAIGLASTYIAGGVSIPSMGVFFAPFSKGLSDAETKQAFQEFFYRVNQSHKNRGSQSMFSSIQLDLEMPEFLKEQNAIGPGGEVYGKYKDYEEENKRLCHIITQISLEGDALGKPIFFPNLIYNIDNADLSEWRDVFELSARFSIPYFLSPSNNNVEYQTTLGCFSPDTSLWCKIDGDLQYISFKELDKLLEANIGATPIDNIEVLTVDDDKNIIWHKAKNFIKNEPQELYQIKLAGNKTFVCDKNHSMITYRAMNKKNILDCKSNLLDVACILNDEQSHLIPDKRAILYGFYLGDGKKGADFNKGYANLMLLKEDKIDYVRNLLDGLNIEYKEDIVYHSRDDANYTVFYFSSNEIQKPDLTDINCLAGLLSGLLSSDGYVRINGGFNKSLAVEFVSTDMEYTQLFKWACFNLGIKFSSRIIQPSKNQKNRQPFERVYISCNHESVRVLQQLTLRDKQHQIVQSVDNNYRHIAETKGQSVKEIIPLHEADYTYCFEVNDRIIIGDDFILTGNCRSALPSNWTGDPNIDCMGTGNSVYTTLCLPAVALKSKEEGRDFYEVLDENMQLIHDYNLERLDWIHKLWYEYNVADFMIQKDDDGNQLYDLENATIVMGYLGLSEALEILGYGPIEDCNDKAIEIMKYMKQTIDKWKKEDNKRWGLFQTPAENATYKLAQKMVKRFGFKESYAKGSSSRPYYTNSNHIPYDDDINLIKRIKIEGNNQPLGPAGNIMNIYTSEAYSEPTALAKFCERIRDKTNAYFWAFTGDYSICNECGTMFRGVVDTCTFDKSPTTQYSRVCGYLTAVQTWNPGKKEEFIHRHRYGK